jgi:hypothetical protein
MQLYSHILTLRISHPTLDPDLVSRTLQIDPQFSWRAGDPRRTPKGTPLEGFRTEGYWTADPFSYGWQPSTDARIEDALVELLSFLEPHGDFLRRISQGGAIQIWVSSHSNRNFAIELPPSLLGRLASLNATLVHDVYQGP